MRYDQGDYLNLRLATDAFDPVLANRLGSNLRVQDAAVLIRNHRPLTSISATGR